MAGLAGTNIRWAKTPQIAVMRLNGGVAIKLFQKGLGRFHSVALFGLYE